MCVKCRQYHAVIADHHVEYFATWLYGGGELAFNVTEAKRLLWGQRVEAVAVGPLYENQVAHNELDAGHLDHVDLESPIIMALRDVGEPDLYAYLIDGNHRVARAHRDGIPTLPAYWLEPHETQKILIPPDVLASMRLLKYHHDLAQVH